MPHDPYFEQSTELAYKVELERPSAESERQMAIRRQDWARLKEHVSVLDQEPDAAQEHTIIGLWGGCAANAGFTLGSLWWSGANVNNSVWILLIVCLCVGVAQAYNGLKHAARVKAMTGWRLGQVVKEMNIIEANMQKKAP